MAVLIDEDFAADAGGFSAGSQVASPGADFASGYLSVPTNTTASKSFSAVTSGETLVEFWVQPGASDIVSGESKSTYCYVLPTAGAVNSANSLCTLVISRDSAKSATASRWFLQYTSSSSITDLTSPTFGWNEWVKLGVMVDFDNDQYDLYINDVLWLRDLATYNTSAADISRFAILNNTSAPATLFDNVLVESAVTIDTGMTVLVEHDFTAEAGGLEVESLTPDTDSRNINAQPWKIAEDTTLGAFTTSSSNGLAPDASKTCFAAVRCGPEGYYEAEFTTSATASQIYIALMFRIWGGYDTATYYTFRYSGSAGTWVLFHGSTTLKTAATPDPAASATWSIRVFAKGRYIYCYAKNAALDAGSWTLILSHALTSTGLGGLMSEEHAGLIGVGGASADNYVRKFRYTGKALAHETAVTVGDNTWKLTNGSINELYNSSVTASTRNLFWSKGIQSGHRAGSDMGNYAYVQETVFNQTSVKSYHQRGRNLAETTLTGISEVYATFLRRGLWVSDETRVWGTTVNVAPDSDFRPELWDLSYRVVGATGSPSSLTNSGFHDWRNDIMDSALPHSFQRLTNAASGDKVRFSHVLKNDTGWTSTNNRLLAKYEGVGDPISMAFTRLTGGLADLGVYRAARAILVETGALSLDDTVLTELRDDIKTPGTLTFTTGSAKTDASGDVDTDGFNERFGWYEMNAATDQVDFDNAATKRIQPCIRVHGLSSATLDISVAASSLTQDTDYWVDDLGDGSHLIQFSGDWAASANITVAVAGGGVSKGVLASAARQSRILSIGIG